MASLTNISDGEPLLKDIVITADIYANINVTVSSMVLNTPILPHQGLRKGVYRIRTLIQSRQPIRLSKNKFISIIRKLICRIRGHNEALCRGAGHRDKHVFSDADGIRSFLRESDRLWQCGPPAPSYVLNTSNAMEMLLSPRGIFKLMNRSLSVDGTNVSPSH